MTTSGPNGTLEESAAAGQFAATTTVSLGSIAQNSLPAPLARHALGAARRPMFTAGAGNTYVAAFCTSFGGATPASGLSLTGTGIVPGTIATGTQLNVAINENGTWVDVGTALVTAAHDFQSTAPTVALPGVTQPGSYLVYEPAPGTNTTQINLGFALIGDDGTGTVSNGLQFIQVENNGVAEPTPTTTFFPIANASDLDGQSLTPDAQHGAVVDGSNTVYFFSGIPQHAFALSANTVDVTNYGADGDSIASLPSGDEVVVSADDGGPLAVISGILEGTPVIADTIAIPGAADRDGLVISADGKVLLSRGETGLDVYKVTAVAPHAGSTGNGTTSAAFALTTELSTSATGDAISTPIFEDGRDGMAISPADSSRAVVVGANASSFAPEVQLVTGLTGTSPTVDTVRAKLPAVHRRLGFIQPGLEPSGHRKPFAQTLPSGTELTGVTITPDGKTAFVLSTAGIVTFSGVDTGTLTQVGSIYSPTITVPGGTCTLGGAGFGGTLGVLPDGKYLIVTVDCELTAPATTDSNQGPGVTLTIPISGTSLGTPVGQLNDTVATFNDQAIFH